MRKKTCLLVMVLLVGGCGVKEQTPAAKRDTQPTERAPESGVVRFYGVTHSASDVVYVIDRSGSMLDLFDDIRMEVLRSVGSLTSDHRFHAVFFAAGSPNENPPRKLVPATDESKRQFLKYLRTITPQGMTYPVPAIRRAFDVLDSDRRRKSVIFLLTDGEFPDNKKVIDAIKALNRNRRVSINTILFHHRSPDAMLVLKKIAKENGGVFRFIAPDE